MWMCVYSLQSNSNKEVVPKSNICLLLLKLLFDGDVFLFVEIQYNFLSKLIPTFHKQSTKTKLLPIFCCGAFGLELVIPLKDASGNL